MLLGTDLDKAIKFFLCKIHYAGTSLSCAGIQQ